MAIDNTRTVLLVEDEDAILRALHCALAVNGWCVFTAKNGLDAVVVYDEHQNNINILVTDVDMPGLTGPLLAEQLLKKCPTLPILFMSGGLCGNPLAATSACNNHGFLQKPFSLAEFFAELERLCP